MALTRFLFATSMLLLSFLVIASASDYGSSPKPKVGDHNPKLPKVDKPKHDLYSKLVPHIVGIQGLVLCKSGLKSFPIKGAMARISCLAEDEHGYETAPFSILSGATDAKGYIFTTLSPSQLEDKWKLTECKTFLDYSPLESCKVPTDVNNGVSGHLLDSYRNLNANIAKNINLYSVGRFFYTTEPKSPPNNGY